MNDFRIEGNVEKDAVPKILRAGFVYLVCAIFIDTPVWAQYITTGDVAGWESPHADARINYGTDPLQFVELRLPKSPGSYPIAIIIHGGCWLAQYDVKHIGRFASAVTELGIATWSLEYRRVGDAGGGWPGTFQDIARGADHLSVVANKYSLDLNRVIVIGHSSGGHLALWLAARRQLPQESSLFSANPISIQGVLALAPATDLQHRHRVGVCDGVVDKLMGGSPEAVPDHYRQGSPSEMLPLGVKQVILIGDHDTQSRIAASNMYFERAKQAGDSIKIIRAEESAHFEVIAPHSSTWKLVRDAALSLLKMD